MWGYIDLVILWVVEIDMVFVVLSIEAKVLYIALARGVQFQIKSSANPFEESVDVIAIFFSNYVYLGSNPSPPRSSSSPPRRSLSPSRPHSSRWWRNSCRSSNLLAIPEHLAGVYIISSICVPGIAVLIVVFYADMLILCSRIIRMNSIP